LRVVIEPFEANALSESKPRLSWAEIHEARVTGGTTTLKGLFGSGLDTSCVCV